MSILEYINRSIQGPQGKVIGITTTHFVGTKYVVIEIVDDTPLAQSMHPHCLPYNEWRSSTPSTGTVTAVGSVVTLLSLFWGFRLQLPTTHTSPAPLRDILYARRASLRRKNLRRTRCPHRIYFWCGILMR